MQDALRITLFALISATGILIFAMLAASVIRRAVRGRRYRLMDLSWDFYRERMRQYLMAGVALERTREFRAPRGSIDWDAVESVMLDLSEADKYKDVLAEMFALLGYVEHYESSLTSHNRITASASADKLGRMGSAGSVEKLLLNLDGNDHEVITVTVRSLGRIGTPEALKGLLMRLPRLLSEGLIPARPLTASLILFGTGHSAGLVEFADTTEEPSLKAIALEVLSVNDPGDALELALRYLSHPDPEVRSKALKVIEAAAPRSGDFNARPMLPLLDDPVWFVRLHAVRALGSIGYPDIEGEMMGPLMDENWHVRGAAATELAARPDSSVDVFLNALTTGDEYLAGSICEEIEKTEYYDVLIKNLGASAGAETQRKSREILRIMRDNGFRTPLTAYAETGGDEALRASVEALLAEGQEGGQIK